MSSLFIAAFLSSLVASLLLTRYVRNHAVSRGWVSGATSQHHIHGTPLPRFGGVAIYLSFVSIIALVLVASVFIKGIPPVSTYTVAWLVLCATVVFLLGVYDDLRSASPWLKIAVQVFAAMLLYFGGFRVLNVPFVFGEEGFGWIALPLTVLWVLLITNAFNLIDGLDGLAGGSALFSTLTVFTIALINGNTLVALLAVTLGGAIVGFLRYNFNPATIFLGDCGSLFIGFMLSALAIVGSQKASTTIAVAIPVVSFGLPVLETLISILRRFLNGQPLFSGDRQHIHHKLLERGFSHRQAVILLYAVSAIFGLLSLLLLYPGTATVGVVLLVLGVGIWIAVQHLGYHEFNEIGRVAHRTIEQKRVIVNNLAIRRATADLDRVHNPEQLIRTLEAAFKMNDFDGFRLSFWLPEQVEPDAFQKLRNSSGGDCFHKWSKPHTAVETQDPPSWNLRLDLLTPQQQKLGTLVVYREHNGRPLLVDINLIISDFHKALAKALNRTVTRALAESKTYKVAGAAADTKSLIHGFSAGASD
jgi:UDP-GlcNAc:undecaprenyl-phosphate GlcNAc-1-phosphate transferase